MSGNTDRKGFGTERLHVRPLTLADLNAFHLVWGDPAVIFWGASFDLASSAERLACYVGRVIQGLPASGWFAVLRRADHVFLGDVVLEPASWDPQVAEIGWHVATAHQRRGYATEAAAGLLYHARRDGLEQAWAKILPDNVASQRVAEHIGMRRVGTIDHAGREHGLWRVVPSSPP